MSIELTACQLDEIRHKIHVEQAVKRYAGDTAGFISPEATAKAAKQGLAQFKHEGASHVQARHSPKHREFKICPACGMKAKATKGKIHYHRAAVDAAGYAYGPFCDYVEI
jgi:hypothetical protein